ncbi:neprilysin-1-like [Gigantopelta aegis]|uniref:neprilysin-1-like n=1 Tax=Gigantopelta aegis TaxID=1735272 RepID=UPI001B88E23F|nr:neprilysin-1-like [Gigantopelta aegis]
MHGDYEFKMLAMIFPQGKAYCSQPGVTITQQQNQEQNGSQPGVTITQQQNQEQNDVCTTDACVKEAASLLHAIDRSVDPCEDFYQYSCGGWMRTHTIPEDKSELNRFGALRDDVQLKLKVLLDEKVSNTNDIDAIRKLKYMFHSCINESLIAERGIAVVRPLLKGLGGWPVIDKAWSGDHFVLEDTLVKLAHLHNNILVMSQVQADDKNSSIHIIVLDQADLGMPSRDYYLKPRNNPIIQAYEKLIHDVAVLFGADDNADTARQAKDIVDLEIKIANLTLSREERRDMNKLYNKFTIAELKREIPQLDWLRYLQKMYEPFHNITITDAENVVAYTPEYFKRVLALVKTTDTKTLVNYMIWRIMQHRVNNLQEKYRDLKKEYNRLAYGQKREPPKWRTCASYVNNNMGDAVGRLFIDSYFTKEAKQNALNMIGYLRKSFNNILREADWMDEQTRRKALSKAGTIMTKIGYHDDLLNDTALNEIYDDVEFYPDKYFENVVVNLRDLIKDSAWYLRQPVDVEQWTTYPAVVNAFYSSNRNSITFPAAILQPPFYSKDYPMSLMFGGIGVVIGHEITHGFDDEGSQFDEYGNIDNWWTTSSKTKFTSKAQCLIDQYSKYQINGDYIRGKQTLGENMADNGGLKASYEAYQTWLKDKQSEQRLPGLNLTHGQLFFVNFAQGWCSLSTAAATHNQILTDPHTPGMYRVIGSVSNSEYFSHEFKCPVGSPMNPAEKCGVW